MAELEDIYEDTTAWVSYALTEENVTVSVYARCPDCGRYIKHGQFLYNDFSEQIKLVGWICKVHGEIQPHWDRWDNEE